MSNRTSLDSGKNKKSGLFVAYSLISCFAFKGMLPFLFTVEFGTARFDGFNAILRFKTF